MQLPYGIILQFHKRPKTGSVRVDDADRTGIEYEQFRSVGRPGYVMIPKPAESIGDLMSGAQIRTLERHDLRRVFIGIDVIRKAAQFHESELTAAARWVSSSSPMPFSASVSSASSRRREKAPRSAVP